VPTKKAMAKHQERKNGGKFAANFITVIKLYNKALTTNL
jgi:hypothetical protein